MPSSEPNEGWVRRLRAALGPDTPAPGSAPPSLPDYECLEKIGEGGIGDVYRAIDKRIGRTVAIKFLKERAAQSPAGRARFVREAQAAGQIMHPNLAAVFDVGEANGHLYLVMEFVAGKSLDRVFQENPLEPMQFLLIMERVARGLAEAHARGVVHRDLKPGNIMITAQKEPKVVDFGLAVVDGQETRLTQTGVAIGTPIYMAPEQASGDGSVSTPRTDVHALGAILYEGLTGRPPYIANNVLSIFRAIQSDDPERPRRLNPLISRDLERVILKSLEKDPDRRYANAGVLADELKRVLDGEPVLVGPGSEFQRTFRSWRRSTPFRIAALVLVMGLVAVTAWAVTRDTSTVPRMIAAAMKLESRSKYEEAAVQYDSILKLAPDNVEAGGGLLRARTRLEQWKQFRSALQDVAQRLGEIEATRLHKPNADHAVLLAQVTEIRRAVEPRILAVPELPEGHAFLGRCWDLEGYPDAAEASWNAALERDAGFREARFRLGRHLLTRAFLAKKAQSWEEIEPFGPESQRLAEEGRRHIHEWLGRGTSREVDLHATIASAFLACVNGRMADGLEIVERGLKQFAVQPGAEELYWLKGLMSPTIAEEIDAHSKALADLPGFPLAALSRGIAYTRVQRHREAINDFTAVLRMNPRSAEAFYGRACSRKLLRETDDAIKDFEESLRLNPKFPHAHYSYGHLFEELGRWEDAKRAYTAGLALIPDLWPARLQRARICRRLKQEAAAMEDYGLLRAMTPRYGSDLLCRGQAYRDNGRVDEAIRDYTKALEGEGGCEENAHFFRALALVDKGDINGAISDFSATLKFNPTRWGALFQRAGLFAQLRKDREALVDYERATEADPRHPNAWIGRAVMNARLERYPQAVEAFEQALKIAPVDWPDRTNIEQQLARAKAKIPR